MGTVSLVVSTRLRSRAQRSAAGKSAHTESESFWRRNALGLTCFAVFGILVIGLVLTGHHAYNAEQEAMGSPRVSFVTYLGEGHFWEALFENWESEFLQMGAFIMLTAFFVQRGSAESKREDQADPADEDPRRHRDDPDAPWPVRRGGPWLRLYENSLLIAFVLLFLGSIAGHALGGAREYSEDQLTHGEQAVSTVEFITTSQFWFESFQNWQSEFLAVGSIVVLTIFLRQRSSPESKPVHAPHRETD